MSRVRMVCSWCGGENVEVDATAVWNKETQEWEIKMILHTGGCFECGEDIEVEEDPIEETGHQYGLH